MESIRLSLAAFFIAMGHGVSQVNHSLKMQMGRIDESPRIKKSEHRPAKGRATESIPFNWQDDERNQSSNWCFRAGVIAELRSMYADIVCQPLPDHIGELVSSLIKQEDQKQRKLKGHQP